jgi:hypothetical protein
MREAMKPKLSYLLIALTHKLYNALTQKINV